MTLPACRAERVGGVVEAAVAMAWRCALSVSEYAAAEKEVEVPEFALPGLR